MKKPFIVVAFLGLCGGALVADDEEGKRGFDNRTIEGTFAFSAHGEVGQATAGIPPHTPVVAVGIVTFDRDGTCVATLSTKVGFLPVFPPGPTDACTFNVGPDGIGTIQGIISRSPFSPLEFTFSIVDSKELLIMETDELVLSGVLKRQTPRRRH